MSNDQLLTEIYNHVQTMNREMGELQSSVDILWKVVFLVLGALVVNIGVAGWKQFKNNRK